MQEELIRQTPLWAENWPIAYSVIQAIVILLVVVLIAALMSFIERRLLGLWQDRYGPNRVGPGGMFQIVADMLKIMFKEDWTPKFVDKLTFRMAPAVAMATAGAKRKVSLSANFGVQSSLNMILSMSATIWNIPPGPTRFGP